MKTIYIETNGCAVLRHETYKIAKYFELNGYTQIANASEADVLFYTGCGVVDTTENYAIESIRRMLKVKKKEAKMFISGCIPVISKDKLSISDENTFILKYNELSKLDKIFSFSISIDDVDFNCAPNRHHSFGDPEIVFNQDEIDDELCVKRLGNIFHTVAPYNQFVYSTRGRHLWRESDLFEIRVAYGCEGNCSYCATKLAIGKFRSINENRILEQVKLAIKEKYMRIMLMGDEIGYWQEEDKNIVDLIKDIHELAPDMKIGIRYISPDIITKYYKKLERYFAEGVIYYFCAAFQSGSPKILRLMNRNPDIGPFIECMEDIEKKKYPVMKHSQIIVGFPGETDEDVLQTLLCLYKAAFDHVTITKFCPRKGTKAYEYPVPPESETEKHYELLSYWLKCNREGKIYRSIRNGVILNNYDN